MGVDQLQGVVGVGAAHVDDEGPPLVHGSGPVVGVARGLVDLNARPSENVTSKAICFVFINVFVDDSPAGATDCILGPLRLSLAVVDNCGRHGGPFLSLLTSLINLEAFIIAKADDL